MTDLNIAPDATFAQEPIPTNRRVGANSKFVDITKLPSTSCEAIRLGLKHYYTGFPCINGHTTYRYVTNEWCVECANISVRGQQNRYPIQRWAYSVVFRTRSLHKKTGIPFDLTRVFVESLATEFCPALGIKLNYGSAGIGGLTGASATLDRIIPNRGYVCGNVVVISHAANRIKTDATSEEIGKVAAWLGLVEKDMEHNGSYSPPSDGWAVTFQKQSGLDGLKTREHVKVMLDGKEMILADACMAVGIQPIRVRRLRHSSKERTSYQDAFDYARSTPFKPRRTKRRNLTQDEPQLSLLT